MGQSGKVTDTGLLWAKWLNAWAQVGTVISVIQFFATVTVLYTVTISPKYHIPIWLYYLLLGVMLLPIVWFILKKGISGYYRFFNQQSNTASIEGKVDAIIEHFKIEVKK